MIAMSTALDLASLKPFLGKLQTLERELMVSLIERDEVIRASLVALVTELSRRISPQNGAGLRSFAYPSS
jgi:hypothetical protein